jgi:hypothetical protein
MPILLTLCRFYYNNFKILDLLIIFVYNNVSGNMIKRNE